MSRLCGKTAEEEKDDEEEEFELEVTTVTEKHQRAKFAHIHDSLQMTKFKDL